MTDLKVGAQGGLISAAYVVGPVVGWTKLTLPEQESRSDPAQSAGYGRLRSGGVLTQRYGAPMAYTTVAGLIAVCGAAYATLPAWHVQHGTDSRIREAVVYKRGGLLGMQEPRQRTSGVEMRLGILLRDAANDWRSLLQDPRQQVPFRLPMRKPLQEKS